MKGFPEDQTLKTQDYPVVIWRKNFGTASVFAVNGDYMGDETGLGLLTGMVYETRNYLIYPVVNAQNLDCAELSVTCRGKYGQNAGDLRKRNNRC
ncbi:MAG: hypothetical protein ACLRIL_08510 [Fusicatenibacter saccharivorans]